MLLFKRKTGIIAIYHKHNFSLLQLVDIVRFTFYYRTNNKGRHFGFIRKDYFTVENRLDEALENIFNKFSSTVKNEIRRSEKENIRIAELDIAEYLKFHNDFAQAKGIAKADHALLQAYKTNLYISSAMLENKILSAHVYITDNESSIARLLFSSSCRFTETLDRNFIGRANKYLHFKDIEYLKFNGFCIYDLGGYANNTLDKQRIGINKFKLSFGGKVVKYNDYQSFLYYMSSFLFYLPKSIKKNLHLFF